MDDWLFGIGMQTELLTDTSMVTDGGLAFLGPTPTLFKPDPLEDPLLNPPSTPVDDVYVWHFFGRPGGAGGGGQFDWGEDTTTLNPEPPPPCTPPPNGPTPDGVDMDDLRTTAKEIGRDLDRRTSADGNEWGALIYRNADGSFGVSGPHTVGSPNQIGYPNNALPAGATLIAEIHSHPYTAGVSQGRLSEADEAGRNIIAGIFNVDPNFMTYIWDERNDEMHEFDSDDHAMRQGVKIGNCYG